jgi:microcystin-dependent protein
MIKMAYNQNLPVDNTADIRENFRALKEDKIVAAASAVTADSAVKLANARTISLTGDATGSAIFDGSVDTSIIVDVISADTAAVCTGNAATTTKLETARTINGVSFDGTADITITQVNGKDIATTDEIPTSLPANGGDADTVDGKHAVDFAPAGYVPPNATETTEGSMSAADKAKLDGIETGAQVNQNAFSNVVVNGTTIHADGQTDTIELVEGTNIALTADAASEKVTIAVTGKVASAAQADNATSADGATKLVTARAINGVAFDGTADITITAEANGGNADTLNGKSASDIISSCSSYGVPSGAIQYFAMQTAPAGWLEADGTAVSRTEYASLFAATGTLYGEGDGSLTFSLPDLRGEFVRGFDNGRGVDIDRTLGSKQEDATKKHMHAVISYPFRSGTSSYILPTEQDGLNVYSGSLNGLSVSAGSQCTAEIGTTLTGGNETRPRNVALLACIKY